MVELHQWTMLLDNSAKRRMGGAIPRGETATPAGASEAARGPSGRRGRPRSRARPMILSLRSASTA